MSPKYIDKGQFVVVMTPHWQEKMCERNAFEEAQQIGSLVDRLFRVSLQDVTYAVRVGTFFNYYKKKYNVVRKRWELELISLTPSNHLHTFDKQFAVEIK